MNLNPRIIRNSLEFKNLFFEKGNFNFIVINETNKKFIIEHINKYIIEDIVNIIYDYIYVDIHGTYITAEHKNFGEAIYQGKMILNIGKLKLTIRNDRRRHNKLVIKATTYNNKLIAFDKFNPKRFFKIEKNTIVINNNDIKKKLIEDNIYYEINKYINSEKFQEKIKEGFDTFCYFCGRFIHFNQKDVDYIINALDDFFEYQKFLGFGYEEY